MPPIDNPYGDEVSADEEAELNKLMESNRAPEPDDQQGASTDGEPGEEELEQQPAKQPEPKPEPQPGEGEGEGGEQSEDERLAAFLEKHKGKSPEELARIAYQQQSRANRAEFDGRKSAQQLSQTLERISAAREAALKKVEDQRAAFKAKLAEDPDAALLEARSAQLGEDEARAIAAAEAAEFEARASAAVEFAAAVIPDFQTRAPVINSFGQEIGFSPDELNQVVDGRQIVTLHLASIAGNMIKAGLIDSSGKFLQLPEAVVEPQGQQQQQRPGFSRQPARGAGVQKTLQQRLADVEALSDAELDALDPAALEALLREAEG